MTYQLNGINVHEGMYARAKSARANGKKVFITKLPCIVDAPDAAIEAKTHCLNCDGCGRLSLEIIVGGPYQNATDKRHVIWHKGEWYVHDFILFICPDCNGSGLFHRQAPRAKELSL